MVEKVRLSDEELLQILRDKAAENDGRAPVRSEIPPEYRGMIKARFGPWNGALRKAGLVPMGGPGAKNDPGYISPNQLEAMMPKPYEEYTDEELLSFIKDRMEAPDKPPRPKSIPLPERYFLNKRFGSLMLAYVAAGTSIGNRPVKQSKSEKRKKKRELRKKRAQRKKEIEEIERKKKERAERAAAENAAAPQSAPEPAKSEAKAAPAKKPVSQPAKTPDQSKPEVSSKVKSETKSEAS